MSHNVLWTASAEDEFRSVARFTKLEKEVFDLHMEGCYTQKQIGEMLGVSAGVVNKTLKSVKMKYKQATLNSSTLPPFLDNQLEILKWQERQIAASGEISTSMMSHLIDEWIFDEKSRKILKRRILDNIKYEQLAEEFDMSVRQIKSIVQYAERKVLSHIN